MYLLDTDTYSNFLRGHPKITQKLLQMPPEDIFLSAITAEEMLKGRLSWINEARSKKGASISIFYDYLLDLVRDLNRSHILRYDADAETLFQSWPQSYKQSGSQDARIAAVAAVNGLIVVTCNTRHFDKIIEVRTQDWSI